MTFLNVVYLLIGMTVGGFAVAIWAVWLLDGAFEEKEGKRLLIWKSPCSADEGIIYIKRNGSVSQDIDGSGYCVWRG